MQPKKAIIIGSGVAGMATAIRLAIQGIKVCVYEKNSSPGGKITAFEKDGFHFDAGPSLFTQPQNIEELFILANEPMEQYFSYQPLGIACRYFYDNGKIINAYTDAAAFSRELEDQLDESAGMASDYLKQSAKGYENIGALFLDHSLHKSKTWLNKKTVTALRTMKWSYLFKTLHQYNSRQFKAPEAIQLFNRFATYNGSNPYKAPGMLSLIPHLEHNSGTYYPAGGMISITNALYNLALKKGVKFYFNNAVQRIIHHQGKAKGIVANNENIFADTIISNSDIFFTYKNLLKDDYSSKKNLQQERSSSAVIFYWGINKQFPALHLHNIFFSSNYQKEFDCIFNSKEITADPTIYINITSRMENKHAPAGKENWFVMVNAPVNSGQDWDTVKKTLRGAIIKKLNRILKEDIAEQITAEQICDPLMIEEQTASYRGALYGTSSNSKLAAFFRHPNFAGDIKGLYFSGGSVHPGGGIPLCLKSAKIVSELIAEDIKKLKY